MNELDHVCNPKDSMSLFFKIFEKCGLLQHPTNVSQSKQVQCETKGKINLISQKLYHKVIFNDLDDILWKDLSNFRMTKLDMCSSL